MYPAFTRSKGVRLLPVPPIKDNIMKPGYYLIMANGQYHGPMVSDNPERDTYLDERILQKVQYWAKRLNLKWKFID